MSYPFYRQRDIAQCGIACLKMVCKYYGKRVSFARLLELCPPNNAGVSLLALSHAATTLRMSVLPFKATLSHLTNEVLPCILHWNQNHYVVLYHVTPRGRYVVADPSKGIQTIDKTELQRHWQTGIGPNPFGIALLLRPQEGFESLEESLDDEVSYIGMIRSYVFHYKRPLLSALSIMLFGCLVALALPFLTQSIVDIGILRKDASLILLILLGQFVLIVSQAFSGFVRQRILLRVSLKVNIDMVSDFIQKLFRLPMSFFEVRQSGDLLLRMSDHGIVQQFLSINALEVVPSLLSILVFGGVLLFYNPFFMVVLMLFSILYILWMYHFVARRRLLDSERFECESKNTVYTYQLVTKMQEIKLQGCEERRNDEWKHAQTALLSVVTRKLRLQQQQEGGQVFLNEVKNFVITAFAALSVISGDMTLGMMLSVQYIIGQLNYPIQQLMSFLYIWQDVKLSLERIHEVRSQPEEGVGMEKAGIPSHETGIRFCKLSFKYDIHSLSYTLRDITFDVPLGKVTAIVGTSGSGKSTLIKLMLGYYHAVEGKVLLSDTPIEAVSPQWWRSQCGVVMQESVLFSDTIEQNIVMSGVADEQRLHAATRAACINDFIESLPLGYQTKVGQDGLSLSHGQRQRILLSRIIYKSPRYVFLDEATNALDAISESKIVRNLRAFFSGKTVVIVAHRLSTVRDADQIVVVDKGKVVETGSHDLLVRQKGFYYHLIKNQLELGR